ncbi:MAG TPA: hypothetical protein VHU40_02055 [Polyangia bacterium]|nr:hypothetical protein [Polyangia bacterium]
MRPGAVVQTVSGAFRFEGRYRASAATSAAQPHASVTPAPP